MTGAACGAGNVYLSGAPDFTSGFDRASTASVLSKWEMPSTQRLAENPVKDLQDYGGKQTKMITKEQFGDAEVVCKRAKNVPPDIIEKDEAVDLIVSELLASQEEMYPNLFLTENPVKDLQDYGGKRDQATIKERIGDSGKKYEKQQRVVQAYKRGKKRSVQLDMRKSELPLDYSTKASQLIDQEDVEATDYVQPEVSEFGHLIHSLCSAMKFQNREQLSQIKEVLCRQFKQHIISVNRYLLYDTWVGYIANGVEAETEFRNVRIVALYDHQALPIYSLPKKFKCIPIYWREKDSVSEEAIQTSRQENIHINLKTKLSNETVKGLFKKHSNLTIVHPSSVKSESFGTVNSHFKEKACIALYCHVKGIIPLGEREFDKKIDGVITDVREGFCKLNGGENMCPGSGISSRQTGLSGTVGAFVEDTSGHTAFVTAAHVVVPISLWEKNFEERQQYLISNPIPVCKNAHNGEEIGKVINWCFSDGTGNQKCTDAALVQVDKQSISTENMFAQSSNDDWKSAGYNSDEPPKIRASKLLKFKEINDKTKFDASILKYGITTQITLGHFIYDGACIKLHNSQISYNGKNEPVVMYGLVGVQGRFNQHFGQPGDSGALCCIVDKEDRTKIYPFGMVVAVSESDGISYITHLEDVFDGLNLDMNQKIKLYPSSDPPHRQEQTSQDQSNSQVNAPETSSTATEKTKEKQSELQKLERLTEERFQNIESMLWHVRNENKKDTQNLEGKLNRLLEHLLPQTSRTPAETHSGEEM